MAHQSRMISMEVKLEMKHLANNTNTGGIGSETLTCSDHKLAYSLAHLGVISLETIISSALVNYAIYWMRVCYRLSVNNGGMFCRRTTYILPIVHLGTMYINIQSIIFPLLIKKLCYEENTSPTVITNVSPAHFCRYHKLIILEARLTWENWFSTESSTTR